MNEKPIQSIISDCFTFIMVVGIIGCGVYLQSTAMQWAGFLMLCILALGKASGVAKKMTPEEAIKYITENFLKKAGA